MIAIAMFSTEPGHADGCKTSVRSGYCLVIRAITGDSAYWRMTGHADVEDAITSSNGHAERTVVMRYRADLSYRPAEMASPVSYFKIRRLAVRLGSGGEFGAAFRQYN